LGPSFCSPSVGTYNKLIGQTLPQANTRSENAPNHATTANLPGLKSVVVLIVDESLKTRKLIASILDSFGVGTVLPASNGAHALEIFQQIRRNPDRIGVSGLDLIIADWEMTQIDGAALLRWIRRHPKSPDPYLPFIAMSTEPSKDQVRAARDLGASQFIARPITIEVLCDQLDSLAVNTRNFIKVRGYFGPDRRHHDIPVEVDLRCHDPAGRPGVRHLLAPNRLAAKLGGRFEPEPERLAEAQKKLDTWQREFVTTIQNYLARAESQFAVIEKNHDAEARHRGLANLNRIGHQIQSYGRNFGFPLVITLARSLHQLTCQIKTIDREYLELVRAHLDALQAVLSLGIKKDGGKVGRKLIQELFRANSKFVRSYPDERLAGSG